MRIHHLSAVEARERLQRGDLTSESLVGACLERIQAREPDVQAWAYIDPDAVLREARERDCQPPRGPLHGLPIGVKDVIDTVGIPTEYGSPAYRKNVPLSDAASVALARKAGAVVMGKTTTTEYALRHPAPTRNPLNIEHSPGGSSSGSAAAVADFMVPLAVGTQTGGSMIRPASFCGIVGFKPTFGLINPTGVKPLSQSNDTVGVYGRSVPDAALLVSAIAGFEMPMFEECIDCTIGVCMAPEAEYAEPAMIRNFEEVPRRLANAGIRYLETALPVGSEDLLNAQETVYKFEMFRSLSYERITFPHLLSEELHEMLARAEEYTFSDYVRANENLLHYRRAVSSIFAEVDVLITPSAPGEAPKFARGTGDAVFNKMWTGLHLPAISIPLFVGPNNLPMGAQLISERFEDAKLMQIAHYLMRTIG